MKLLRQILTFLNRAVRYDGSPSQLAWGVAIGIAIGLMPKDNLLAVGLVVALFTLRVNIASGLMAACFASAVGLLCDPLFNHMGLQVLNTPTLESFYTRLANSPWGRWTSFNNTVVMGALFIGVCQLLPTYFLFKSYFTKHLPNWAVDSAATVYSGNQGATSWRVG